MSPDEDQMPKYKELSTNLIHLFQDSDVHRWPVNEALDMEIGRTREHLYVIFKGKENGGGIRMQFTYQEFETLMYTLWAANNAFRRSLGKSHSVGAFSPFKELKQE